ncbi:MAG: hypothetical protein ACQKBU_12545, partial [Verrucomicrobiales bacterium]
KTVINLAATKLGIDPQFLLPESELRAIVEYINTWTEEAWDEYPWPDLIDQYEDVTLTDGALDIYDDLDGGSPIYIGRVKPTAHNRRRNELPYRIIGTKVVLDPVSVSTVYVEARSVFVRYPSEVYDPAAIYSAGDTAYWATTGEGRVYDGSGWSDIRFPKFLLQYVGWKAAAEAKRERGDLNAAQIDEARANAFLEKKVDDLEIVQGQRRRWRVDTGTGANA